MFGVDLFTYNAAKVFITLFVLTLVIVYSKELFKNKVAIFSGLMVFIGFILINLVNPNLSGLTRLNQISFGCLAIFQGRN